MKKEDAQPEDRKTKDILGEKSGKDKKKKARADVTKPAAIRRGAVAKKGRKRRAKQKRGVTNGIETTSRGGEKTALNVKKGQVKKGGGKS